MSRNAKKFLQIELNNFFPSIFHSTESRHGNFNSFYIFPLLTASLSNLNEFTICMRIKTYQFTTYNEVTFSYQAVLTSGPIWVVGAYTALPCDQRYSGCTRKQKDRSGLLGKIVFLLRIGTQAFMVVRHSVTSLFNMGMCQYGSEFSLLAHEHSQLEVFRPCSRFQCLTNETIQIHPNGSKLG